MIPFFWLFITASWLYSDRRTLSLVPSTTFGRNPFVIVKKPLRAELKSSDSSAVPDLANTLIAAAGSFAPVIAAVLINLFVYSYG